MEEEISLLQEKLDTKIEINTLYKPSNRIKASEEFHSRFINNQEFIKKTLPEDIIKEIADIRVYVLDKASHKVIDAVTKFCEENRRLVNRTANEYKEYYKQAFESFDRNVIEKINFHDCYIKNVKQTENYLSLLLDNSGGFTDIDEVQFERYKILKQDGFLENSWWLYNEIYKVNDKYELHVLLQNGDMNLVEFIISTKNISFKRS